MVVLHHTDCGIRDLAAHPAMLAGYFEAPEAPPVDDPYRSVVVDVEALRATMPPTVTVSGLVYDVATGLVRKVI